MKTPVQRYRAEIKTLLQEVLEEADIWKTCLHCQFFNEELETCSRCTPPIRPPARVIVFGCPGFLDKESGEAQSAAKLGRFEELHDDIPF